MSKELAVQCFVCRDVRWVPLPAEKLYRCQVCSKPVYRTGAMRHRFVVRHDATGIDEPRELIVQLLPVVDEIVRLWSTNVYLRIVRVDASQTPGVVYVVSCGDGTNTPLLPS